MDSGSDYGFQFHEQDDVARTSDDELLSVIERLKVHIKIFGAGGAGSNSISRLMKEGIKEARLIACNTDAPHLLRIRSHNKILLGKNLTRGLGSGADPKIGEEAARESEQEILKYVSGSDIMFITAGLGGGTGTGSAHYIARIARNLGALTIGVVTLPFKSEGVVRKQNADWGLNKLINSSDTVIIIPNDKLLELVPDLPLEKAFKYADEIIVKAIVGLTDLVTNPGLINLDFNDLKTIMQNSGVAMIGIGVSKEGEETRIIDAVDKAVNSPFLQMDMSTATGVIVNVKGGRDLQLQEANNAAEEVQKRVGKNTKIIWGANIDDSYEGQVEILIVATGLASEYNKGRGGQATKPEDDLDFVA
ncbi:cell division protein FtsZ [uncultured archaeon]|nr:cell division protein FtsZ [uncultured archaeon]HKJ97271.1 cell division protein FtsZ [Thermoplasmataceae archaeon]